MSKTRHVVVIEGEDAAPEAMRPSIALIESLGLPIVFEHPPVGLNAKAEFGSTFPPQTRSAIDAADASLFGATSGPSGAALFYLRWGKQTYANVRPCRWLPGYRTPLIDPHGMDFVVVRENLEDLYLGLEGDLAALTPMQLYSANAGAAVADLGPGRYAIKAITEKGSERVVRYAFELARRRAGQRKVTVSSKYNMLRVSDGFFRDIAFAVARDYPDIVCDSFIIDDFLCRMITRPQQFDVVVMPNLYGDIISDGAAGLLGGLGLAASGCYGDDYAYFESAHGTAPDIAGKDCINPTATLLSACMMLDYLGFADSAERMRDAIARVYAAGETLTPDQGGHASTTAFCAAIAEQLGA